MSVYDQFIVYDDEDTSSITENQYNYLCKLTRYGNIFPDMLAWDRFRRDVPDLTRYEAGSLIETCERSLDLDAWD